MNRAFVLIWCAAIPWWLWIFHQPYETWMPFGFITLGLLAENYIVNVKARSRGGFEETNPLFVLVEQYIPFKYASPLGLGIVTVAMTYYMSTIKGMNFGLATIPLIWAPTFALALICSLNDAYQVAIAKK